MYTCDLLPSTHSFFFFNPPATTEIYTLSLHDALPISPCSAFQLTSAPPDSVRPNRLRRTSSQAGPRSAFSRSEEHTSELQSRGHLVCRLLLEKKKKKNHEECAKHISQILIITSNSL